MALAIGGLLACPAAGTAEDNGPPYPVIALHLEVTQSKSPPPVPEEFACDDSQINSALLNVTTSQESANVYVIALDVPSDVGLKTAAFGIEANSSEFYVQWESYASSQQPTPRWPDPGSGNRLTFDTCQGTVPDPTDPEGDGFVVLGKFYLWVFA
jgi:hypothetical protein